MTVVGKGWTQVVVARGVNAYDIIRGGGQAGSVVKSLPRVSGSWGDGRLLKSSIFSALITDDGRVVIGAVSPDQLYAAAAHK